MKAYPQSSIHSSSSVPDSMMCSSSSLPSLEHGTTKGNTNSSLLRKVPRPSFLKLAKSQRFETMMEILNRSDDYDLNAWIFPGSSTNTPVNTITSAATLGSSSSFSSSTSSRNRIRPLFPLSPTNRDDDDEYNLSLFRGETPLHILLRYHPTNELVHRLVEYLSQSAQSLGVPEDAVDMMGRTPLHVAAAHGGSVAVVKRLLQGVSAAMPAFAKDATGRHALHWACANPQGSHGNRSARRRTTNKLFVQSMEMVNNMVQVVKVLLKAYPESVFLADHNGHRPKDLARIHHADERILLLLSREERRCELDNQYQTNLVSVAETTRTVARDVPTTLPFRSNHRDDDVSSIGSSAMHSYSSSVNKEFVTHDETILWTQSPFQNMTKSDEVIRFVEQTVLLRPPLVQEEFDFFSNESLWNK